MPTRRLALRVTAQPLLRCSLCTPPPPPPADSTPLLIFPEGTCVNNEYCVMFKRGAFDLGALPAGLARGFSPVVLVLQATPHGVQARRLLTWVRFGATRLITNLI